MQQRVVTAPPPQTLWPVEEIQGLSSTPASLNDDNSSEVLLEEEETTRPQLYLSAVLLVVACVAALLVNAYVLAAVCWIKRPLSRTLRLSVSLAAADALSSLCFGLGLLVNSILKMGFHITVQPCFPMALEVLRLGAMVSVQLHLLALACHHFMGILQPFKYPGASFSTCALIAVAAGLWVAPPAFFAVYFSAVPGEGFQTSECTFGFMRYVKYRALVSGIVFAPLAAMFFIYLRIFALVRRHEAQRPRHHSAVPASPAPLPPPPQQTPPLGAPRPFSRWSSSRSDTRSSVKILTEGAAAAASRYQRVARQAKAARTTLLIVGSCAMGWVPALSVYVLLCEDCPLGLPPSTTAMFYVYYIVNLLIIVKTLLNPIIYAARMTDIKSTEKRLATSEENNAEDAPPAETLL